MAEDLAIKVLLELRSKTQELLKTTKELQKTKKAAKQTRQEINKGTKAVDAFSRRLVAFVGGAVLLRFAKQSLGVFASWERQLRTTAAEAERLGLDVEATTRRVMDLTTAIERQTGILRQDTLQVYNKFLGLTGDVEQATLFLRAAVGAEEAGFKDLTTAANLLGSILQGEVIEPSKSLGLAFDQTKESAEQQADVLEEALDKLLNLSDGIDDTKGAMDSFGASINRVKIALGELLSPVATAGAAISEHLLLGAEVFGRFWDFALKSITAQLSQFGTTLAAVFDFKTLFSDPQKFADQITFSVAQANKRVLANANDLAFQLQKIRAKQGQLAVQSAEDEAEAKAKALATASQRAEAARTKREAAEAAKLAKQRIDFESQIQDQMLRAQLEATEEGSQARLDAELAILERLREQAVAEAMRLGADVATVEELFRLMKQETIEEDAKAKRKKAKDEQKDFLAVLKERAKAEIELQNETAAAAVAAQEMKKQAAFDVANATLALGRAVFGESKLIAAAEVIVNTAAAVMQIQRYWAWNPPVAAALTGLTIATGVAQLANIRNAEPGGGGFSASGTGGAISVPEATPAAPTIGALPTPVTEDQGQPTASTGDTYVFQGPTIVTDPELRRFVRKVRRAEARDIARRVG